MLVLCSVQSMPDSVSVQFFLQVTQWHHPRFFAYFPASNSYVATTADILSDGIGCIGFSWVNSYSPAAKKI